MPPAVKHLLVVLRKHAARNSIAHERSSLVRKVGCLMKNLAAFIVLTAALVVSAAAQETTGMSAMQYYVGTWSCVARPMSGPPLSFTATNRIDLGIMRQWFTVAPHWKMTAPEGYTATMTYDSQNRRYVETQLHYDATWQISSAKPWSGNIERWTDIASSDGKLSHVKFTRINKRAYNFAAYPTLTATTPYISGSCRRSP